MHRVYLRIDTSGQPPYQKRPVALDLNKLDGQTIHKKMACFFPYSVI